MGMDVSGDNAAGEGMTSDEILALAKAWIERALSSVAQNDSGFYIKMLKDLRDVRVENPASVSALQLRLRVLAQSVYFINDRYHQALLDHLLGMSIWIYGGDVGDSLLEFVVNLATANGAYVGQCMDMLVRNFLPPSCGLPSFLDTYSKAGLMGGWLSMEKILAEQEVHLGRKEDVLKRLHAAIKQLTALVPTTPLRMQPIVFRRMPHRSAAKEWNILYLENMLRLENSGGHYIASQMLPAVIDQLIQIDVEIRWEDILTEEDNGKVYMFHMDLEEEAEMREPDANEAGDPAGPRVETNSLHGLMKRPSQKVSTLDEMADKMDLMMDMTLEYLQVSAKRGKSLQVYDTLMKSFQSTILHTHKSKFTQFLIFYLCSLAPNTCGNQFAYLLCDISTSKTCPPNTRMSAAAYLASYLARAKYLSADVISTSLKRMVSWCIAYGGDDGTKSASTVSDSILHGVFFSVCQAVMYSLCFRFKMLIDDLDGKRVLRGLPLQQLVDHRLNPLKVCLPTVVEEFLRKASILQLVDQNHWRDIKERCDRNIGGVSFGDTKLDMFFPFDPYLLRQSDRFIRPSFNFWYMVEPLAENDASDFEDNHDDAASDISSDTESSLNEHAQSPHSNKDERLDQEFEGNFSKSDSQYITKSDGSPRLEYKVEATSPYSDDGFVDFFQNSFDAMAITPPHAHLMPAKLPAKLPSNFSPRPFHI